MIGQAGTGFFTHALEALATHPADTAAWVNQIKQVTGAKGKALFQPLRAALTGELDGPELGRLLPLLSLPRAQRRLAACTL